MIIYVNEAGSSARITEGTGKEGVTFKESSGKTTRESSTAGGRTVVVEANLPEVSPVPPEFAQSDGDVRVWHLPSGRLIITDLEGNLEQITTPQADYQR